MFWNYAFEMKKPANAPYKVEGMGWELMGQDPLWHPTK
jgi:hypothetical protein